MTLTSGRGPLSANRDGWFTPPLADGTVYVEPFRRRVRGMTGDDTVVDSESVLLVHRPGAAPVWAFPAEHVHVDARPTPEAPGFVEVDWNTVDSWWQEDTPVLLHAPNPYHRVEYLPTRRRLRVAVGDVVIVDSDDTVGVWETGLEPRLYVRPEHVDGDLLRPSDTESVCPYKGTATYWSLVTGDTEIADAVWAYLDPLPEAAEIAGLMSFWGDELTIEADLPPPASPE